MEALRTEQRGGLLPDEEACWRTVLARDALFDNSVVYAVRSTGIYCRPSCPSRRPLRKNVRFFPSAGAAEQAGFRPCRRCHPRLFVELLEKKRMEEELQLASEVQRRLQPVVVPSVEGWELTGISSPCREIGGDYYDIFSRPKDGRVILALGDVAGKGVGAALLMASLHAAVRVQSGLSSSVHELMVEINRYLFENMPTDRFATLFYAELEPGTGRLAYSTAGHHAAVLARRSGGIVRLRAGGRPLGLRPDTTYEVECVKLEPGDVLVLFSDGLIEATNEAGEEFGEARLLQLVREHHQSHATQLRDCVGRELAHFSGSAPPDDDRALVILRRAPDQIAPVHTPEAGNHRSALC